MCLQRAGTDQQRRQYPFRRQRDASRPTPEVRRPTHAGKLLSELMLDGRTSTLNISPLAPSRFASAGASPREYNVI